MKNIKVIHKKIGLIVTTLLFTFLSPSTFAVEQTTNFEVNVIDTLSVSITTPDSWASGGINEFLRNKVSVSVNSNNSGGFTASMYSANNTTNLTNVASSSSIIPTLASSSARSSFPANYWGYSLGEYTLDGVTQSSYTLNGNSYGETTAGNNSSYYYPLVSTSNSPIVIMDGTTISKTSGTQNVYFGAKANATKASGTYLGTVIISVVTGVIDNNDNPVTPVNPVIPSNDEVAVYNDQPVGGSSSGATSYTYRNTSGSGSSATTTTTTEISEGDNRSAYNGYTPPQGVVLNVNNGASVATGLGVAASIATASAMFFFIVAKRKEDDEEEEEEVQK